VKINRPASRYLQLASRWRAHDQRLDFRTLRAWVRCERAGCPAFAFPIPSSMDDAQAEIALHHAWQEKSRTDSG